MPIQAVQGDLLDPTSVERAVQGVDWVFHVAGRVRLDAFSAEEVRRVNVGGTEQLLRAARKAGASRVVHVSSVAALGGGPRAEPADEDAPYPLPPGYPYAESKRDAEALALAAAGPTFEVVVVNPGFAVGAYDVGPSSGALLLAVARGVVRAYPSGGTNVVNASDVAAGMWAAMERGRSGERYILGGENLTYRELIQLCAEEAGVPPPRLPLPQPVAEGAARVLDTLGHLKPEWFGNFTSPVVRAMFRASYHSSGKAQRALGYRPRSVRAGIREAYRWFQEQGRLPRDRPLTPHGPV